jgi:hypothetical protein
MRDLDGASYTALQNRRLMPRDFVWFVVRDRTTGAAVTDGYWSDVGTISAQIIDPDTGGVVTRSWAGAGSLIKISDIALVSTITVSNISVTLSQVADRVQNLVRGYDCKQGRIEIYRGLFDPVSRTMVAPATARFLGTIDEAPITTPRENDSGDVTLTCTSNTAELTRTNPDTRSDPSQRLRLASDDFFVDSAVVGGWQQFWGRAGGAVRSTTNPTGGRLLRS